MRGLENYYWIPAVHTIFYIYLLQLLLSLIGFGPLRKRCFHCQLLLYTFLSFVHAFLSDEACCFLFQGFDFLFKGCCRLQFPTNVFQAGRRACHKHCKSPWRAPVQSSSLLLLKAYISSFSHFHISQVEILQYPLKHLNRIERASLKSRPQVADA